MWAVYCGYDDKDRGEEKRGVGWRGGGHCTTQAGEESGGRGGGERRAVTTPAALGKKHADKEQSREKSVGADTRGEAQQRSQERAATAHPTAAGT